MIDAAVDVAHDASVIATVVGHQILKFQAPLVPCNDSQLPPRLVAVLQPGDVWLWIAHARTLEAQKAAGRLHHGRVHVLRFVERRRPERHGFVVAVLARVIEIALVAVHLRVQVQRTSLQ